MDFLRLKKIKSRCRHALEKLEEVKKTTEFINPQMPELLQISVGLSIQGESSLLYQKLKQFYIKQQSNEELEYYTILAAYSSGNYKECLFLAQDLLVARNTPEVYFIILKLCINKLNLGEAALHYSEISLMHNPGHNLLATARAVACIYNANISTYAEPRLKLLEEALSLLNISQSTGKNILFYKAITQAQLRYLNDALQYASEGLKITMDSNYCGLVALIMLGQEDFTGALAILKRGIQANPCNFLLYGIK